MTTAIIGTGGIGSAVARELASGGEPLRLASADHESARTPADLLESSSNQSPKRAALFYAADDDRAGHEVERLIRTAGFEPAKVGGLDQSTRLEVGGDLHELVVAPTQAQSLISKS